MKLVSRERFGGDGWAIFFASRRDMSIDLRVGLPDCLTGGFGCSLRL